MESLREIVMGRKSVRSFDGNPVSDQHRQAIEKFAHRGGEAVLP